MEYVIETENLTKQYGKSIVVDNVSIHVPKGKIYAPVIICSFMQAIGMANGNIRTCQTNIILP